MLTLIYKDLLTPEAAVELDDQFRKIQFQFPPRWRRLQSGNSHLDSWRMLQLAHGCTYYLAFGITRVAQGYEHQAAPPENEFIEAGTTNSYVSGRINCLEKECFQRG